MWVCSVVRAKEPRTASSYWGVETSRTWRRAGRLICSEKNTSVVRWWLLGEAAPDIHGIGTKLDPPEGGKRQLVLS